ncbi:hypothetical protein BHM03_00032335 [Ensete ventricosum]|nr:hypothetical protein BHM03_00032335 [Ensete ventricosum]
MASADGRGLRRFLFRSSSSSSSRPHAAADRNALIGPPPSSSSSSPAAPVFAGQEEGARGGGLPRARLRVGCGLAGLRAGRGRREVVGGLAGEAAAAAEGEEEEEGGEGRGRLVRSRDAVRGRGVRGLRHGASADGWKRKV